MKYKIKRFMLISGLAITLLTFSGCKRAEKNIKQPDTELVGEIDKRDEEAANAVDESQFKKLVVTIGKDEVTYSEAIVYLKYIQTQYEAYFGDKIWDFDFGSQNFSELAKQEIMNMMVQTRIACDQMGNYNIEVTDEEEELIKQKADKFLSGITTEDKEFYGLTEEVVRKFYYDNMVYEKVYDASTMNVNSEVSDEEARHITIWRLLIKTKTKDKDGNLVPISNENKSKASKKAKELLKKAKEAENFDNFAEANTEGEKIEYTFGKGEMDQALVEAAFALKTGELSGVVETDEGYEILYCVTDYNEDATLERKEEIIADRQDLYFRSLYEEWSKEYKIKVNDKVWNTMDFTSVSKKDTKIPAEDSIDTKDSGAKG